MSRPAMRMLLALSLCLALSTGAAAPTGAAGLPAVGVPGSPVPVLAYYYIWFTPSSWNRAKTDYPALGRYSSDDETVMRTHVRWAKAAGINGFIVSWKHTDTLDRRLQLLIRVATSESFKLAIIYQGLDFTRRPQPVARVADDLRHFAERYAHEPVFDLFGKPMVIWSGTWEYTTAEIGGVTRRLRRDLLMLASERNPRDYERVATLVDGDAYYWSSVNPDTHRNHAPKLKTMAERVHRRRGLWIAPAAPGFDARLIGGRTKVERHDGATLRKEFEAALTSSPDAIGLISWNEFSENSHVEPSLQFGSRYLRVLAELQGGDLAGLPALDSSDPTGRSSRPLAVLPLALGFVGLTAAALLAIARRGRRRRATAMPFERPDRGS